MKPLAKAALVALAALTAVPAAAQGRKQKAKEAPAQQQEDNQPPGEKKYDKEFPTKANWNLKEMNGKPPPADASLTIDGALRGSGSSGCNTWSATLYPIRGQKLAMGPVAMTKKTCDAAVMAFERAYLVILHSGPTWEQEGDSLIIKGAAGSLRFARSL